MPRVFISCATFFGAKKTRNQNKRRKRKKNVLFFCHKILEKRGGDWGDNCFSVELGNIVPAIYSSIINKKSIYSIVRI